MPNFLRELRQVNICGGMCYVPDCLLVNSSNLTEVKRKEQEIMDPRLRIQKKSINIRKRAVKI